MFLVGRGNSPGGCAASLGAPNGHNIEFSCAAATDQPCMEFTSACADPYGLQGVNCNDLLGPVYLSRSGVAVAIEATEPTFQAQADAG
jgi:hypothetical protein